VKQGIIEQSNKGCLCERAEMGQTTTTKNRSREKKKKEKLFTHRYWKVDANQHFYFPRALEIGITKTNFFPLSQDQNAGNVARLLSPLWKFFFRSNRVSHYCFHGAPYPRDLELFIALVLQGKQSKAKQAVQSTANNFRPMYVCRAMQCEAGEQKYADRLLRRHGKSRLRRHMFILPTCMPLRKFNSLKNYRTISFPFKNRYEMYYL
jgi:hypothetical protein